MRKITLLGAPIPAVAVESEQYMLTSYDLDAFLNLIQLCHNWEAPDDCRLYGFSDVYFSILQDDFERFYPDGIPGAERLIEGEIIQPSQQVYAPSVFYEIIHQGLLNYLNANDVDLVSGFEVENPQLSFNVLPVDLDGDASSEFVIEIMSSGYGLQDWMVLDVDENGRYKPIPNTISPGITAFHTQANVDYDLTGDGIPEVLLTQYDYLTSGSYGGFVEVHTWEGEHLQFLINVPYRSNYANGSVEYEIADVNENGLPEIRILWQRNGNYECRWEQIDTYEWNGVEFEHTVVGDVPPETAVCSIARGLTGYANLNWNDKLGVSERMQLLEAGQRELNIENAPSGDYISYVTVQLAMMYAVQGENEIAMELLESSLEFPAVGNEFTELVQNSLKTTQDSPLSVCNYLMDVLFIEENDVYIPDILDYVMIGGYPVTFDILPEKICPLNELVRLQVETMVLLSTNDLIEASKTVDLPLVMIHKANFDDDPEIEWIGYVDLAMPTVVLLDPIGDTWIGHVIDDVGWYPTKIEDYGLIQTELDDDGFQDVLLWIQTYDSFSLSAGHVHRVLWLEQTENGLEQIDTLWFYEKPPILVEITLEDFKE